MLKRQQRKLYIAIDGQFFENAVAIAIHCFRGQGQGPSNDRNPAAANHQVGDLELASGKEGKGVSVIPPFQTVEREVSGHVGGQKALPHLRPAQRRDPFLLLGLKAHVGRRPGIKHVVGKGPPARLPEANDGQLGAQALKPADRFHSVGVLEAQGHHGNGGPRRIKLLKPLVRGEGLSHKVDAWGSLNQGF